MADKKELESECDQSVADVVCDLSETQQTVNKDKTARSAGAAEDELPAVSYLQPTTPNQSLVVSDQPSTAVHQSPAAGNQLLPADQQPSPCRSPDQLPSADQPPSAEDEPLKDEPSRLNLGSPPTDRCRKDSRSLCLCELPPKRMLKGPPEYVPIAVILAFAFPPLGVPCLYCALRARQLDKEESYPQSWFYSNIAFCLILTCMGIFIIVLAVVTLNIFAAKGYLWQIKYDQAESNPDVTANVLELPPSTTLPVPKWRFDEISRQGEIVNGSRDQPISSQEQEVKEGFKKEHMMMSQLVKSWLMGPGVSNQTDPSFENP